jgi:hypothetical protein
VSAGSDPSFLRIWTSRRDFAAGAAALAAGLALVGLVLMADDHGFRGSPSASRASCQDAVGEPLKAKHIVAAYRSEGFTMRSLEESFYCDPSNFGPIGASAVIVADVSNRRSVTQDEDVVAREGWATCLVERGSRRFDPGLRADLDRGPDSPIFSGTKAVFGLANVTCSLYPQGDGGDEQIRRAHAAMRRLERQLAT